MRVPGPPRSRDLPVERLRGGLRVEIYLLLKMFKDHLGFAIPGKGSFRALNVFKPLDSLILTRRDDHALQPFFCQLRIEKHRLAMFIFPPLIC